MSQKKRRVNIPSCRYERTLGQLPYHLFSEIEISNMHDVGCALGLTFKLLAGV